MNGFHEFFFTQGIHRFDDTDACSIHQNVNARKSGKEFFF